MQACTRHASAMTPVDTTRLGKASIEAGLPDFPLQTGKKIAVIGGGPAGISVAWQLRREGFGVTIYDRDSKLGGKITTRIPRSRIPDEIVATEINRVKKAISHVHLRQRLTPKDWQGLKQDFDFVVLAIGAQKPRTLPVPGKDRMIPAIDFLAQARENKATPGKKVVVIGAGNVGCDVAAEAYRLGSEDITLIDVQAPASLGKERAAAEAVGANFRWPCFTKEITADGVKLDTGEIIPADTVFISIGDLPDLDFLPPEVTREKGFIKVDASYQTSDSQVFAIGDAVRPGLLTDAIGAGRRAAAAIKAISADRRPLTETHNMISKNRVSLEYFDPRIIDFQDLEACGSACASCGACRDCGICVEICPESAISKVSKENDEYEYVVDETRCIGCGFCAGACPCGVWDLIENTPLEAID